MNPITNIKNQNKLNDRELNLGISGDLKKSWHQQYKDSAWIYIGGLPFDLSEGDIITVFSQFGEVININLVRHPDTGKSKGFCFLCYQDQRSTVLAVDNFNGITLLKRMIRVDHVESYKVPKYKENADEETKRLWEEGCAPKPIRKSETGMLEDEELKMLQRKIKKDKKKAKKEKKKAKKEEKRLKKMSKHTEKEVNSDWKTQSKLLEKSVKEEELYGHSSHFNFGKKAEAPEEPTHNPRPDFEKADWRDIEIWKEIREREKAEQEVKKVDWKPEEHYVSSRYR
ncbi:unnamed protein product [Nippostrongylus brasiliensis]|uniref:RNA-binding motif protein, X-linked 2 (inferred by orthology to a human protein) n=1 Tax=Nippostrongylus brasiliensis TaxID=27835 RepID=A0A0N4XV55_NIPBR|nr:unnamed protein product [Nippostrongylus brasiliensis]